MKLEYFSGLAVAVFFACAIASDVAHGENPSKVNYEKFPQYREFLERNNGSKFLAACYPVLLQEMEGTLGAGQMAREAGGSNPLTLEQRTEASNLASAVTELNCACWGTEFEKRATMGSEFLDKITLGLEATQNFELALAGMPPIVLFQFGMAVEECSKQIATVEGEEKYRISSGGPGPTVSAPSPPSIAPAGEQEGVGAAPAAKEVPEHSTIPKPSFDCTKAGNDAEREICSSVSLSDLDRQLSSLYRCTSAATTSDDQKAYLRAGQLAWMRTRNSCGNDSSCIATHYNHRIEEIASSRLARENCISE
jgi:uncharacterized protein YecT (DUF1311 family)